MLVEIPHTCFVLVYNFSGLRDSEIAARIHTIFHGVFYLILPLLSSYSNSLPLMRNTVCHCPARLGGRLDHLFIQLRACEWFGA